MSLYYYRNRESITKRRSQGLLWVLILLPVCSWPACGGSFYGDFASIIRHQERPYFYDTESFTTWYNRLSLNAYDVGAENLSLHAAGWFKYDFQDSYDEREETDLKTAYLRWQNRDHTFDFQLGRQWIYEGVGVAHLDGVKMTAITPVGLGFTLYGGRPLDFGEYDDSSGDIYTGFRTFYRMPFWKGEVGVSGDIARDDDELAERRLGFDLALHPLKSIDITGYAFYDDLARDWMDERIDVVYRPTDLLHLNAGYQNVVPSYYVAKTSIFSVFSNTEQERYNIGAGYDLTNRFSVYADYAHVIYDQPHRTNDPNVPDDFEDFTAPDGQGDDFGVKFRYRFGQTFPSVASVEVRYQNGPNGQFFAPEERFRDSTSPDDRFIDGDQYILIRGYVMYYVQRNLFVTLDSSHYIYEEDLSNFVSVGADYRFDRNWELAANIGYGTNPYVEDDYRLTLKVVRRFNGSY